MDARPENRITTNMENGFLHTWNEIAIGFGQSFELLITPGAINNGMGLEIPWLKLNQVRKTTTTFHKLSSRMSRSTFERITTKVF